MTSPELSPERFNACRNVQPSERARTEAEGSISKDGAKIGELGLEVGSELVSSYVLVGGQETVLETTAIAQ